MLLGGQGDGNRNNGKLVRSCRTRVYMHLYYICIHMQLWVKVTSLCVETLKNTSVISDLSETIPHFN